MKYVWGDYCFTEEVKYFKIISLILHPQEPENEWFFLYNNIKAPQEEYECPFL
jgi:hypothetical protein